MNVPVFILEYYFQGQLNFVGSAYFVNENDANAFGAKFCNQRPGYQFKIRICYFMPPEK